MEHLWLLTFADGGHKAAACSPALFVSEVRWSIQTAELTCSWKCVVCLPPSTDTFSHVPAVVLQ